MEAITISQITERLRNLPADKLVVVYDFVSYLSERETGRTLKETATNTVEFMLASETVLSRDWNRPEEDTAWANL